MLKRSVVIRIAFASVLLFSISACRDKDPVSEEETWSEIKDLQSPLGMAKDSKGRIWVTECGTGNNDGRLVVISPDGRKTTALAGLPSILSSGSVEGLSRPYIKGSSLLFAHGIGGLIYSLKSDVSTLSDSRFPLSVSDFDVWDINSFARGLPTSADANTNVMDLFLHDDGDLYILDAGANVIIRKEKNTATFSLFAEFPKIPTPAPFPVSEEAVPTGFVFDGTRFLVSALSGFPFNAEHAKIFSVSMAGQVAEYKTGFTNLIRIQLDKNNKPVVLQHGLFSLEAGGFQPGTGSIVDENGIVLAPGFNQPADLLRKDDDTYYVLSYADGTLKKVKP